MPNIFIFVVLLAHIGIVALILLLGYVFVHKRRQKTPDPVLQQAETPDASNAG